MLKSQWMNIKIFKEKDNQEISPDKYKFKIEGNVIEIKIDEDQLEYDKGKRKTEKYRVEFEYEGVGSI